MGRGHLGRLECDHRVAAGAIRRHEPVMEMLHRGLRMERDHRVLELVGADPGHDVRRDEDEAVADGDFAAPDVGLQVAGREAALAVRIGERRESRLADQVRLCGADRRDVQLVVADDGDPDPDRAVVVRSVETEPLPLVIEALVR